MASVWRVCLAFPMALMVAGCANPGVRYAKPPPRSPDFQGSFKSVDVLWVLPKSLPTEVEYKLGNGREYMARTRDVSGKMLEDLKQGFFSSLSAKLKQAGVCVKMNDASESTLFVEAESVEGSCTQNACTVKMKTTVRVSSKKEKKIVWKDEYQVTSAWPLAGPVSVSAGYYDNVVGGLMRDQMFSGPRC
jgi:hypothetical protein